MDAIHRCGEAAFRPRSLLSREGVPFLTLALEFIEREWGSIEAYLDAELGVDDAMVDAMRTALLSSSE